MLTRREQDCYNFIHDFIARKGHGPLLNEISSALGIHSKGTAHRYVQSLAKQNFIILTPGRHRGISLPHSEADKPNVDSTRTGYLDTTLPLLGRIAAGQAIEAIPDQDSINLVDFFMAPNRFVLKVQGDSMIDAGILDGDMVIIEQRDNANNGEIVVALLDGNEVTLKYLRNNRDNSVTLIPANSTMTPMIYAANRVHIQGIVTGQMRSYR